MAKRGHQPNISFFAFTATPKIDPDLAAIEYAESGMKADAQGKHIKEKELPERFGTEEYQELLVADKHQAGFDQPLLHTMYVNKPLSGIQAVQTLSRLNRTYSGKEGTFVLDFVNEPEGILKAFQPYYEQTLIGERAEARHLYELQAKLDAHQVYFKAEIEELCQNNFYTPKSVMIRIFLYFLVLYCRESLSG